MFAHFISPYFLLKRLTLWTTRCIATLRFFLTSIQHSGSKVCRQKITEGLQVFTIASSDVSFYFIFCSSVMSFVLYSHLFICCLYITSCYSTLSLFVLILMLVLRLFHLIQTYVLRFDKNAMKSFHIVSNLWACIPVHIILNDFKHLLVTQSKSDYKK